MVLLEKAAKEKDFKVCAALTKKLKGLRVAFTLHDAVLILNHYIPDLYKRLQLQAAPTECENPDEKLHCTS